MSEVPRLGEIAFGEPLVDAGFGPRNAELHKYPIFTLPSHPELIVRALGLSRHRPQSDELVSTQYLELTEGLLHLDNSYGLHTPGLSMAREVSDGRVQHYLVTPRVNGTTFNTRLNEVPENIATGAFDSTLKYHEDFPLFNGVYLDDIGLRQLVYGRLPGDVESKVYFVDVEQQTDVVCEAERWKPSRWADQGVWLANRLSRDINLLETAYSKDFSDFRKRAGRLLLSIRAVLQELNGNELDFMMYGGNTSADRKNISRLLIEGAET